MGRIDGGYQRWGYNDLGNLHHIQMGATVHSSQGSKELLVTNFTNAFGALFHSPDLWFICKNTTWGLHDVYNSGGNQQLVRLAFSNAIHCSTELSNDFECSVPAMFVYCCFGCCWVVGKGHHADWARSSLILIVCFSPPC